MLCFSILFLITCSLDNDLESAFAFYVCWRKIYYIEYYWIKNAELSYPL